MRYGNTRQVTRSTLLILVVLIYPLAVLIYSPVVLVYPLVVLVYPLAVLIYPLVVLVYPLVVVVSACPIVALVWAFVCPLVVLVLLYVSLFASDHFYLLENLIKLLITSLTKIKYFQKKKLIKVS